MLLAYSLAAELGSFSAAARRMGKAQSVVSTALSNLEIDLGVDLFDRSSRFPVLTKEGETLLPYAEAILKGNQELIAKATSLVEGGEDSLVVAIEQGIHLEPLDAVIRSFDVSFPQVTLSMVTTAPNETAVLLKSGQADIGLMTEQENYPTGFQFRGIGHAEIMAVCNADHPLAGVKTATYRDLRAHRQVIVRNSTGDDDHFIGDPKSANLWYADTPQMASEILLGGVGWAELPAAVVAPHIQSGELKRLRYAFQQSDMLDGIDLVWTERKMLGAAGSFLRDQVLALPQEVWRGSKK